MADLPDVTEVAILGGGPVGLDAALAAREAGFDFRLLESAPRVGASIRGWGHVRLFSPWSMNLSPRMREALSTLGSRVPDEGEPTGQEFVEHVLEAIATVPDMSERIHTNATVLSVGREGLLKHQEIASEARGARPFRVIVRQAAPGNGPVERILRARIVLDCTGSRALPNAIGNGGVLAPGERDCTRLSHDIPDPQSDPTRWAGKRVLVVGSGHSAQTAVVRLAEFATSEYPGAHRTRVYWLLKSKARALEVIKDDPLPQRAALLRRAQAVMATVGGPVEVVRDATVEVLENRPDGVRVHLKPATGEEFQERSSSAGVAPEGTPGGDPLPVDLIVGLTGSVGDPSLYRQLQVHECYATSGPMKLAAALLGADGGADCLAQESHGAATLANPEPNFYILGSKSYGRTNTFLLRVGWQQVTDVFSSLTPVTTAG